jgi:zinc protease
MRSTFAVIAAGLAMLPAYSQPTLVTIPSKNPIITFRFVLRTGSADDPEGKAGAAALMSAMLSDGGTKELTYKQIIAKLFPMASGVSSQVDKEMITFSGSTHIDNLENYYQLFKSMLLEPGWRQDDFERLRDDAVNYLRVTLRGANDEELGKEVLYNEIYKGTRYGHENVGRISALKAMTVDDLKEFYKLHFTQHNLIIGLAGGYPAGFDERVKRDFEAKLPEGVQEKLEPLKVEPIEGRRVTMIEKNTRSVAFSLGFPIGVRRGDPDYAALLVVQAYFGQHRNSGGRLYERMRAVRGLNYGDYAYIEYFPQGMYRFEPSPNLGRSSQIFQIWIRPVEPPTAVFALRLALFEFDKLINEGLIEEAFQRSRSFVQKYTNLLMKTSGAQLGYLIDSKYYGIPDYKTYIDTALAKLTREDVNRAIKKHLQSKNMEIVIVAQGCEALKKKLTSGEPSPMTYNSPKPEALLEEDKIVATYPLDIKADAVKIVPEKEVFE